MGSVRKAKEEHSVPFLPMSNSILFHAQGVRGFEHQRWDWSDSTATCFATRQPGRFRCPSCGSADVTATPVGRRTVKGLPLGTRPFELNVQMHRLKCHDCGAYRMEQLPFLPSSHARITRALQRTIVELRAQMSISAIASYFGVDWKTVKDAEKEHLRRKYRTIDLHDVTTIGIDEIHIGRRRYKTVVRDLQSGAVLHVGDGRGADALKPFGRRLTASGAEVETVAMDMAAGYGSWVQNALPNAVIVYDHFHLVRLMNEKLDRVRRRTVAELDDEQNAFLKKNDSCC
jgi:transposase